MGENQLCIEPLLQIDAEYYKLSTKFEYFKMTLDGEMTKIKVVDLKKL
jgi:hypothetical protein